MILALTVPFFQPKIVLAQAAGKMSFTVIPPFFQLPLNPGESWNSTIKVVNSNNFDLDLYANLMNFKATGEDGQGTFVPITGQDEAVNQNSLAQWVTITKDPVHAGKESRVEIPFSVHIPKNAPPGGHYAAILIGTKPPQKQAVSGPTVQIATYISTLLFIRVSGDVVEKGDIREFSSDRTFYQNSKASFSLRFENTGNVHLQPQGDITIYNMWGKERGRIEINQNTEFGYVLPKTLRNFKFTWNGEDSLFEIGRYKAVATLTYGLDSRKNVFSTTYFWIVPVKPVAGVLGGILAFILLIIFIVKAYVKKAMRSEAARMGISQGQSSGSKSGRQSQARRNPGNKAVIIMLSVMLIVGVVGLIIYFTQVLKEDRSYEVLLQKGDGTTVVVPKR